jgi:predicted nucleic acid-binding protein
MKLMNAKVFLDTNILLYSYSNSEIGKQEIARKVITENNSIISTQVLQELCNTVTRKLGFSYPQTSVALQECCQNNDVHINSTSTIMKACQIAERYKFSFYDSMIIGAALESGCPILYSEDMHNGLVVEGTLTIINPFK